MVSNQPIFYYVPDGTVASIQCASDFIPFVAEKLTELLSSGQPFRTGLLPCELVQVIWSLSREKAGGEVTVTLCSGAYWMDFKLVERFLPDGVTLPMDDLNRMVNIWKTQYNGTCEVKETRTLPANASLEDIKPVLDQLSFRTRAALNQSLGELKSLCSNYGYILSHN